MLLELGRHDDALTAQRQVVDELQRIDRPSPDARRTLAAAIARRGDMQLAARRDLAAARADYLRSRDLLAELLAQDGARTDVKRDLSLAHERSGDALLQDGDLAGARTEFEACLRLRRELVARDGANAEWQRDLTVALERIGGLQALQGRPREAMAAFDEALRLRQAVWERDRSDLVAARDLAVLWMRIGQAHAAARGTPAQIDTAYARAIELLGPLVAQAAADSRWRRDLAVAHAERGEARRRAGRGAQAREDFGAALSLVVALRAVAPDDAQLAADEAWLQQRLR
jgi:tetratricopeptide (TPR) repeat protein